jgi:hypothetical protein
MHNLAASTSLDDHIKAYFYARDCAAPYTQKFTERSGLQRRGESMSRVCVTEQWAVPPWVHSGVHQTTDVCVSAATGLALENESPPAPERYLDCR